MREHCALGVLTGDRRFKLARHGAGHTTSELNHCKFQCSRIFYPLRGTQDFKPDDVDFLIVFYLHGSPKYLLVFWVGQTVTTGGLAISRSEKWDYAVFGGRLLACKTVKPITVFPS